MTLKNNRAPLLCYFKPSASKPLASSSWWSSLEMPNLDKIWWFFCLLWPWNFTDDLEKMIGHLFYTHSSFMHHFIAIGEFRFEWQSGNSQIGSNLTIFASCDLEIIQMTLKNNRAPLLCPFKLYASFHSHWWVYIWVTVRKRSNWVKFDDFLPPVTLKFFGLPWKTVGHLFYTHSSFMHHTIAIGGFRFVFQYGNAQIGSNLTIFCLLCPWNLTNDLEKQ